MATQTFIHKVVHVEGHKTISKCNGIEDRRNYFPLEAPYKEKSFEMTWRWLNCDRQKWGKQGFPGDRKSVQAVIRNGTLLNVPREQNL